MSNLNNLSGFSAAVPCLEQVQLARCRNSPHYFLDKFAQVYDATSGKWVPFHLWEAQGKALDLIDQHRLLVMLKARQLGFSWLVSGYILWQMMFRPAVTILLFSKTDDEAVILVRDRLKGMFDRIPAWLIEATYSHPGGDLDQAHHWSLENGSRAIALPNTRGRSYTGTLVLIDEADWVPDLNSLLNAVKPTIDAGGKLVLLSSVDKWQPESTFKRIYLAARNNENDYQPIFAPWSCRPDQTEAWYEQQRWDIMARTGCLDDLYQEYPATEVEALSPRSLDKRIHPDWIRQCYAAAGPIAVPHIHQPQPPAIPGLVVYAMPKVSRQGGPGGAYVIGVDPAEGNPTIDDSALTVLDVTTGEEVASLAGKLQPA